LWPKSSTEEHAKELRLILGGKTALVLTMPLVIFVAEGKVGTLVGFMEVDLRSHADGCNPSRPVGYIEGWYVAEDHRHRGIGRKLLAKAEDWARSHRCVEMASDAIIDNELSQRAHEALGYEVVDRCVHYSKELGGRHRFSIRIKRGSNEVAPAGLVNMHDYSCLSATMGSTFAARRAGM
jgi:aminoglycoside 6'-N-acetyltransferase I